MPESKPCKEFVSPKPEQKYGAYCGRCSYSRKAHEMWEQWTADAEAQQVEEEEAQQVEGVRHQQERQQQDA